MVPGARGLKPAPNEVAMVVANQFGVGARSGTRRILPQAIKFFDLVRAQSHNILHIALLEELMPVKRTDRRDDDRIPVEMFMNEYVSDRLHRVVSSNVSPTGIYLHRVYATGHRHLQFGREDRFVQLEFTLPGTSETIWARGEVRYDDLGLGDDSAPVRTAHKMVHGTGVFFTDLARGHAKLIRDYVIDRKRDRLTELLGLIRQNRYH
jgi:hypothetical protein